MSKDKRDTQKTLRVNSELLVQVLDKLNKENQEGFARAKNKHYFKKRSIADIFEDACVDYLKN